jgi:hypothetical protein
VCGSVRGKIVVQERLEIQSGGRVRPDRHVERGFGVAPAVCSRASWSMPRKSRPRARRLLAARPFLLDRLEPLC